MPFIFALIILQKMKHFLLSIVATFFLLQTTKAQTVLVPSSGSLTTTNCSGTIQDHGGNSSYSNSVSGYLVIDPPGTATVSLSFTQFQTESGYDYVRIYNGVGLTGTLLGTFSGSGLPNSGNPIVSTSGAMTVRFSSDNSQIGAGFTANFTAAGGSATPVASFTVSTLTPAYNTPVQFTNTSTGGTYLWLFGDGTTSTDQNPTHAYTVSGPVQVKLLATNCSGQTDTSAITTLNVQAGPNGSVSVDTVHISLPCGSSNSSSFSITNAGVGNLNYSLNLTPSTGNANFSALFEGTGLDGFVNQTPTLYTTTLKTTNPAQGAKYLEFAGDGLTNDGLKATFPASQPAEISYYVKSDSYGTTNGAVEIGGTVSGNFTRMFSSLFTYTTMRLYYGYGTGITYFNYTITQGTWYKIELKNINYVTERFDIYVNGALVLANAEFYAPVTSVSQIEIYNNFYGIIGVDAFYVGNKNISTAVTYNPTTGILANGSSANIFINANATGLNAGTYFLNFVISSNDTALNGLIIPLELTVTGAATLVQGATCFNYGTVYSTQTFTDSVLVTNTGCDTLNITSFTKTSPAISLQTAPFNLAPEDSLYVHFTFSPSVIGSYADTIYANGPDTNARICISALAVGAPNISTDSTSYHIHVSGCPDTVAFPFIIYNTGTSNLNWSTSGTVSGNKSDNFEGTAFNTNVWASWTSGLSQGSSCGVISGTKSLIFNGSGARSIQTVPLNTSAGGTISFNYKQTTCEFADAGEGIYVFYSTNNGLNWTQIQYFYTSSTLVQAAVMTIPVGAQGSNVIFKLQQTSNSGISFDYWIVDDFIISSGITNSMIFTPPSGTTAAAGSTTVTAQIVTAGLANGTYNLLAYVTSNDPVDPVLTIPVTITINGTADMDFATGCKQVATTIVMVSKADSVLVYNSGCNVLQITNAAFATSNFTAITTSKTIQVGDTAYLKFNFVPQTIGVKTDSLSVTTNVGVYKICVIGTGLGAPVAVAATTPINVTLNGCGNSSAVTYTVGNTGQSPLNYKFMGIGADTIQILALTLGYNATYYANALAALTTYMNTPYVITTLNTTSATVLTAALVGKDVLWMAPTVTAQYSGYTNLAPAVQAFLNNGGRFIASGTGYTANIWNLNIFTGTYTSQDNGGYAVAINPSYASDPLVDITTGTAMQTPNKTYYYTFTNTGKRQLLQRTFNPTYDFVTEVNYGTGKALFLGFDFLSSNTLSQQLFANAIEEYGANVAYGSYADWLTIAPDSGQVAAGSSTAVTFTFSAGTRGTGTYTDTVLIQTNDPLKPIIKVPVVLTINGAAGITVQTSCLAFGSKFVGVAAPLPTTISNPGCDTLVITSNTSNTGAFSLAQLPLAIPPYSSVVANVKFTPTTVGFVQDTIMFLSNASTVGICVNGTGLGAPQVTPSVDTLEVTINKCDGFKIVPISVQNTGQGSMTYAMDIVSLYEASSTKYYTTTNATTTHSFLNTPSTADTVFFMVVVNGDFNSDGGGEYYSVSAEGYYVNIFDNNAPDGTNDTSYGYYTGPNIATWLADGQLNVNVINAYGVAINTGLNMHHVKVWMKSTPTWASLLSPSTGTLAIGGTTTKNVLLTASNLNVGTYNSSLVIESNDPVNPVYVVPIVLHVVDKPVMAISANCINYGLVLGATPVTDSVKIYNDGCQNLNITSLQFTNPAFTSSISTAVIPAKDSMWLPVTLTGVNPGPINASVLIYSNDTNLSVCLTATISLLPNAAFDYQVLDDCDGVVLFSDNTTNNPVNWNWDFGDGTIALAQNPTHTFTKPGIYTVKLTSYNVSGVDSAFKVIDMTKVLFVDYSRPDSIFRNTPAQFYDSSLVATQWQWYFGDGGSSTVQNPVHTYANAGVYFVTFVASNADCSTTINRQITVYSGFGIEENTAQEIRVYPVPASDFVVVEWNAEAQFTSAQIVDALGNTLQTAPTSANALTIDATRFTAGIYFVLLTANNGTTVVKKFVIAR